MNYIKKYQKQISYLVATICVALIPIIYYNSEIFNVFLPNSDYSILELDKATLVNMHLEGKTYITDSNDGYLIFNNAEVTVQNIVFHIQSSKNPEESAQVYFDYGDGFNENDSLRLKLTKGENRFKIGGRTVYGMRFDLSTEKGSEVIIDKIELNSRVDIFKIKTLFLLPIFLLFFLLVIHKNKLFHIKSVFYIGIMYLSYSFVYHYTNWALRFLIIGIMVCSLLLIELFFKEVRAYEK